jgi:hypothetical protein
VRWVSVTLNHIAPSRKELKRRRAARQRRWALFWLIAGVILLYLLVYPAAVFVARCFDDEAKEPLVLEHKAK